MLTKFRVMLIIMLMTGTHVFAQKIIFAQDYHYKNNAMSKKLMSSYIFEDSLSKERLVLLSGSKTINFYLANEAWKLQKGFEVEMNKKSAFWNDNFKVNGFAHAGDKWIIIVGDNGDYTAEVVDTKAGTHTIAGKVFEDKDPKYFGHDFSDGDKNYNMYPNRSGAITISHIDGNAGIQTMNIDLSTQLPLNKSKKFSAKELFESMKEMDTASTQLAYFTRSKVQFYKTPAAFVFAITSYDPAAELIYFDKSTGKRIRSDLYSVEDLLPASAKNSKLNTAVLLFDNKVWVYSGDKNASVLAAFDVNTKKVLFSKQFDEKMDVSGFSYGPVEYKTSLSTGKIFSGESYIKEKVEDISANRYLSELWKGDLAVYAHPLNENEYVISVGSYNMVGYMAANAANRDNVPLIYDPRIYESCVAGLAFSKTNFALAAKKTTYNEINFSKATSNYSLMKVEKDVEDPEYKEKRAYIIKQQPIKNTMYTMYYYEDQFKITQKVFPFDIPTMGIK